MFIYKATGKLLPGLSQDYVFKKSQSSYTNKQHIESSKWINMKLIITSLMIHQNESTARKLMKIIFLKPQNKERISKIINLKYEEYWYMYFVIKAQRK